MNSEGQAGLVERAAIHAALGDTSRLRIVDTLLIGDASPSELAEMLSMPSNLLAHHLKALEAAGLVTRRRSEGDGRRTYLRLVRSAVDQIAPAAGTTPGRVVFVCTANSARSHLAAALWTRASDIPATSAGTHPAEHIDARAVAVAARHELPLARVRPRHLDEVVARDDLVITVCDLAHEELRERSPLHWSIPDPVRTGTDAAFDATLADLEGRVHALAPRLAPRSVPGKPALSEGSRANARTTHQRRRLTDEQL